MICFPNFSKWINTESYNYWLQWKIRVSQPASLSPFIFSFSNLQKFCALPISYESKTANYSLVMSQSPSISWHYHPHRIQSSFILQPTVIRHHLKIGIVSTCLFSLHPLKLPSNSNSVTIPAQFIHCTIFSRATQFDVIKPILYQLQTIISPTITCIPSQTSKSSAPQSLPWTK